MNSKELVKIAMNAMENAYAPYSLFKVGAAVLGKSGKIYEGCNVENSSYGNTICAERVAFFNAISKGEKGFSAIAIIGGKNGEINDFAYPCGSCRQVMSEFCDKDFNIILFNGEEIKEYKLNQLLPKSFSLKEDQI